MDTSSVEYGRFVLSAIKGYGTALILELEKRVKEQGASLIQLQAVKDEMHEHFYGKLKFKNAGNFVLKVNIN